MATVRKKSASKRSGRKRKTARARKLPVQKLTKKRRKAQRPYAVERPESGAEVVLALDVSSRCAGWSVFVDGNLTQHGRYVQVGTGHGQRLSNFRTWILAMLTEFTPTQLVYEAPYAGRMRNTFGVLSKYAGVVELCHFEHFGQEIPPANAVPAHLVKKSINAKKGKSHEENKKIVVLMVNQRYSLALKYKGNDANKTTSQDDEADAIALNWAWHVLYRDEAQIEEINH